VALTEAKREQRRAFGEAVDLELCLIYIVYSTSFILFSRGCTLLVSCMFQGVFHLSPHGSSQNRMATIIGANYNFLFG
jgi:hypothetical protein